MSDLQDFSSLVALLGVYYVFCCLFSFVVCLFVVFICLFVCVSFNCWLVGWFLVMFQF